MVCVCVVTSACSGFGSLKEVRERIPDRVVVVNVPFNQAYEKLVVYSQECFAASNMRIHHMKRKGSGEHCIDVKRVSRWFIHYDGYPTCINRGR